MPDPAQTATPLLAGSPLFETCDLDEARDRVAKVYCDHKLQVTTPKTFHARHNRLSGQSLAINYMEYGAEARIAPGTLKSFYLFQFPLRGWAKIRNGSDSYLIGDGYSGVLNPDRPTDMMWSADCAQLMVQADRAALNGFAQTRLGLAACDNLTFRGAADLRTGPGRAFLDLLRFIVTQTDAGHPVIGTRSLLATGLEEAIFSGLLESHEHNASNISSANTATPRVIRLAEAFMQTHLAEPISLEDISGAAGVSPRTLQATFRAHRAGTPLERLRDMRLARVHADLSAPTTATAVTDVAMAWGFFHLGRFAKEYRRLYGCTPVETLRRNL